MFSGQKLYTHKSRDYIKLFYFACILLISKVVSNYLDNFMRFFHFIPVKVEIVFHFFLIKADNLSK